MSDETPPPSLRLKPRQRTDAEAPPAAPAAPAPAEVPEGGKLRLKPKLSVEAPAAQPAAAPAAAEAPPPPAPPAGPPEGVKIRLKPKLNPEPAPAAAEAAPPAAEAPAAEPPPAEGEVEAEPPAEAEAPPPEEQPKVKLKIKIPGALTEAAAAEAKAAEGNVPPPFPVVADPNAPGGPTLTRPPGSIRPGPPGRKLPPNAVAAASRRQKIIRLVLVAVLGLGVSAGMMYLAYTKFIEPPPPPPSIIPKARVQVKPIEEIPVPPPTKETEPVPATPAPPKPVHVTKPAPRATSGEVTRTATTDLAPGVTVTTEAVKAAVEASEAFRSFVAEAKVSGVFQGTPSRAFINGRLVRAGEVVDNGLGIKFESVDPSTKTIVFKDGSGATVSKHY